MKGLHKGCLRKVDNPMKWMKEDKSHFEIKKELQKFLSENDYILNLVGAENESALLLVAEHFTNWNGMQHVKEELTGREKLERLQPSLPSDLDEAAEKSGLEYAPIITGEALDSSGQCYETDDVDWPSRCGFMQGFKAGAEWMAKQGWIDDGSMPPETKHEGNTMQAHIEWTESKPVLAWDSMYGPCVDVTKNGKWMSEQRGGYTGQVCHGIIAWRPIPEYKEKQ